MESGDRILVALASDRRHTRRQRQIGARIAEASKRSVLITSIQTSTRLSHSIETRATTTLRCIECRGYQTIANGTIATSDSPTKFGWLPHMPYQPQEEVDMDTAIPTPPSTYRPTSRVRMPAMLSRVRTACRSRRLSPITIFTPTQSSVARTHPTPNSTTSTTTSLASNRTQMR